MLIPSISKSLDELIHLLRQLSKSNYSNPCPELSNASIGEHTRHIIEMFQCVEKQYDLGIVNYDNRERNQLIQTDTDYAIEQIQHIKSSLRIENKNLYLQQFVDDVEIRIQSNYYRELLYNLEHCIHHQAMIKIAVMKFDNIRVDANFGVARSTIEYKKQCVQ